MHQPNHVFSPDELKQLSKSNFDKAINFLNAGNASAASALISANLKSHFVMHDGYMMWSSETLSYVYENYGIDEFEEMLESSVKPWLAPILDTFRNGVTPHAIESLAQLLRMNSYGGISAAEDDDSITFEATGWAHQRLQDFGFYSSSSNLKTKLRFIREKSVFTKFEPHYPIFLTLLFAIERQCIQSLGYPLLQFSLSPCGSLSLKVSKNPHRHQEAELDQLGCKRNHYAVSSSRPTLSGRLFSAAERQALCVSFSERAIEAINRGEIQHAIGLLGLANWEWDPAHHIWRDWITGMVSYIGERHQEDLVDYLEEAYERSCLDHLLSAARQMEIKDCVQWYAETFHQHSMSFSVTEDEEKFTFQAHPCGSGGRLIQEGAYEGAKAFSTLKFHPSDKFQPNFELEEFPAYCLHCPTTNRTILSRGGPFIQLVDPDVRNGRIMGHCRFFLYKPGFQPDEDTYQKVKMTKPVIPAIQID